MTEAEKKALRTAFARSGGNATLHRRGRDHYRRMNELSQIARGIKVVNVDKVVGT